jgi:hypothetical protein
MMGNWTTYRTRFLIRARQLDQPLAFVDCIGREHSGQTGDYLVLSSDGSTRIAPREIFEDIYVPMDDPANSQSVVAEIACPLPAEYRTTTTGTVSMDPIQSRAFSEAQPPVLRSEQTARRRASGRLVGA